MCVHTCACVRARLDEYIHVCVNVCVFVCICACGHTFMSCVSICQFVHVIMFKYTCVCLHMCVLKRDVEEKRRVVEK